jgi:hypothetical protein
VFIISIETFPKFGRNLTIPKWWPNLLAYPFATIKIHSHHPMVTKFSRHVTMEIKSLLVTTCEWWLKKFQSPHLHGDWKFFSHHSRMATKRFSITMHVWRLKTFDCHNVFLLHSPPSPAPFFSLLRFLPCPHGNQNPFNCHLVWSPH